MKRLIAGLLILLAATAAAAVYVGTDNERRQLMQHAAVSVGQPLTIPNDPRLADPDKLYSALRSAADDARVNVFRTAVGFTVDGLPQTTQYVLLTTGTRLFDAFDLRAGRWLTPEDADHPERFLSTTSSSGPAQVGVIGDFGGNDLIVVRGLRSALDSLPVAATYVVEAPDPASFTKFVNAFADRASSAAGAPGLFSPSSFESRGDSFAGYTTGYAPVLSAVQLVITFFAALFLAFQVLHEAKKAGVMKLHGFGAIDVWFEVAGRRILVALAASEAVALVGSRLVPDANDDFTISVGLAIARAFVVMLAASIVACAYVARTNISNGIKNRKDTRAVFALNTLVKVGCSVGLIAVGAGLWLQYANAAGERAQFGNWERARGYGIFYPTAVGNDLVELQTGGLGTTMAEVFDLYPALNERGALYVDATAYEPAALAAPLPPGAHRSLVVNVNYLHQFPLRDASGRKIDVPDSTTDWVLLIPSSYRDREAEIRADFKRTRTGDTTQQGAVQAEDALFGRPAPATVAQQAVSIIWMEDGQSVFSFDPLINPDAGNNIVDPFLQVMTSANSLGIDRANMLTGSGGTALKIRLVDGDTVKTLADISPTLTHLKLDDNLRHLVTMDEYVSQKIAALDAGIRSVVIAGFALLVGLLVLAVQSASILFERYSRRITVRRLFGAGFTRTYREVLLIFGTVWTVQLVGALIANRLALNPFSTSTFSSIADDSVVVAITAAVVLVECLFSIGALVLIERRGIVRVLKQEF
jgi:hypothetical protein